MKFKSFENVWPLASARKVGPLKARTTLSSTSILIWAGIVITGSVLCGLIVLGRVPLMLAAGASVALAGLAVLATLRSQSKFMWMFFLNACFLVVPQREFSGTDLVVLLSLATALLIACGISSNNRSFAVTAVAAAENRFFGLMLWAIVGFATIAFTSTVSNSQSVLVLLPWLNGIALAILISSAPSFQLPSFMNARRAILVGGGIASLYDLYLLGTGRALNVGPFNSGRFTGSLGDYELLAEFYGVIILLGLTAVIFEDSPRWRLLAASLIVPSFIILLATQSRGPVVILCAVAPALALTSAVTFRHLARKVFFLFATLSLIIFSFFSALSVLPVFARLSSVQFEGSVESTLNRAGVWGYFTQLPRFIDAGLIGNGFHYPYEEIGTYPHSIYLWLLWSGGTLGLIAFVLLISLLLFKLFRGIFLHHSASLSAAAVLTYIFLDEIKIEAARTSASVSFLWVALSLALLASREQREH